MAVKKVPYEWTNPDDEPVTLRVRPLGAHNTQLFAEAVGADLGQFDAVSSKLMEEYKIELDDPDEKGIKDDERVRRAALEYYTKSKLFLAHCMTLAATKPNDVMNWLIPFVVTNYKFTKSGEHDPKAYSVDDLTHEEQAELYVIATKNLGGLSEGVRLSAPFHPGEPAAGHGPDESSDDEAPVEVAE
jgi:hypothetical protein